MWLFRMVESDKTPGRSESETEGDAEREDVQLKAEREKFALVSRPRERSEGITNYSLACSPQVIIREVTLFCRLTGLNYRLVPSKLS